MTIKDLIEKRAKVWETAKNFVETHEDKNGVLSEEDTAAYNKMEKEIEDLTTAIDRQTRAERRELELSKPVNSPITGKPFRGEQENEKTGRASDEYRDAMIYAMRSNFRNVSNVLQEGVDTIMVHPGLEDCLNGRDIKDEPFLWGLEDAPNNWETV